MVTNDPMADSLNNPLYDPQEMDAHDPHFSPKPEYKGEDASEADLNALQLQAKRFQVISPTGLKEITLRPGQRLTILGHDNMSMVFQNDSAFPSIVEINATQKSRNYDSIFTPAVPWWQKPQTRPFTITMRDHKGVQVAQARKEKPVGLAEMGETHFSGKVSCKKLSKAGMRELMRPLDDLLVMGVLSDDKDLSTTHITKQSQCVEVSAALDKVEAVFKDVGGRLNVSD